MRRVVITGMGAITPLGNSVEAFWNGIKEKKTGFGPITKFDTSAYKCRLAAEVKDFDPALSMDKKDARRMELFCQYAVAAAKEAYGQAASNPPFNRSPTVKVRKKTQAMIQRKIGTPHTGWVIHRSIRSVAAAFSSR